jgi:CubicO group peptidase (beta-lactamase class C family)
MTEACLWTELHKDSDVATVLELRAGTWMPAVSAMTDWRDVAAPASGGAAMVTSLRGLIQLASAYVEENPQFLSPDLWRLARTNLVPHGASLRSGYLSPLPGRTIDGVGYGAGVAVVYDGAAAGIPHSLGEIGWEGSTGCFFLANPRLGLAAAFMTNRYPHSAMPWWRALRELIYSRLPELM